MNTKSLAILSAVRGLSTSARLAQKVKVPISVHGVEGCYASALYSAAVKKNVLDQVEKDLEKMNATISKDAKLKQFCEDPSLQKNAKIAAWAKVIEKLGLNEQSKNFFNLIAENGRLNKIESVCNSFKEIMSAHRGEVKCTVTTAKPLDASMNTALEKALQLYLLPGQKLNLEMKTDPSVIGGMIVTIGDRFVDMSISKKIRTYEDLLKAPV